jgi:hypothetical protein
MPSLKIKNAKTMKIHILPYFLLLLFAGCSKGDAELSLLDCQSLETGLLTNDESLVKSQINLAAQDLMPSPTTDDPIGHEENLQTLVDIINNECNIEASIICYACIETYPLLSEILLKVNVNGQVTEMVIDILTHEIQPMTFRSMHEG